MSHLSSHIIIDLIEQANELKDRLENANLSEEQEEKILKAVEKAKGHLDGVKD